MPHSIAKIDARHPHTTESHELPQAALAPQQNDQATRATIGE